MEEEKKKERFFKRLSKDVRLQVSFCVASMVLLFALYVPFSSWMNTTKANEDILNRNLSIDEMLFADVGEAKAEKGKIDISGWALRLDAEITNVTVLLKTANEEVTILKTSLVESEEVVKYAEYLNYEKSSAGNGFVASIKEKELQQDINYEILLDVTYKTAQGESKKKISTAHYLCNGMIRGYNQGNLVTPVFVDAQMATVVREGNLCVYNEENGAWVYLFKNNLYWIFDTKFEFNRDEKLYVFLHLHTLDTEQLPENRRQYAFDNKDFILKTKELSLEQDTQYRVARMELAVDYPITYIQTGHHESGVGNRWSIRFLMLP